MLIAFLAIFAVRRQPYNGGLNYSIFLLDYWTFSFIECYFSYWIKFFEFLWAIIVGIPIIRHLKFYFSFQNLPLRRIAAGLAKVIRIQIARQNFALAQMYL